MDYQDYVKLYEEAVEKGVRQSGNINTEQEWNILAAVTKNQMVKKLKEDIQKG